MPFFITAKPVSIVAQHSQHFNLSPKNASTLVLNASHELIYEIEVAISSAKMIEPATLRIIAGVKDLIRKLTAAEKVSKPVSSDRLTTDRKSPIA